MFCILLREGGLAKYFCEIWIDPEDRVAWRHCHEQAQAPWTEADAHFTVEYDAGQLVNPHRDFCGGMNRPVTGREACLLLDMTLEAAALDKLRDLLYEGSRCS